MQSIFVSRIIVVFVVVFIKWCLDFYFVCVGHFQLMHTIRYQIVY